MSSDQSVTSTDRWKVFSAALSVVLVVDVLTKVVVTRKLGPDGDRDSIDVLSGFLSFSYTRNNGVAFGLLQGDSAIVWISVFLGLVLGGWFVVSAIESSSTLEIVALGCCAGGAVGNIANRLVSGYVTDFIEVGRWPSFNVADAALTIGLTIFLASHIRGIPAPGER